MNLVSYGMKIEEINKKLKMIRKLYNSILSFLTILFISTIILLLFVKPSEESILFKILLIITVGFFVLFISYFKIKDSKIKKVLTYDLKMVVFEVINNDTIYKVELMDDIGKVKDLIRESRFFHKFDSISILNCFKFMIKEIEGIYARMIVYRSTGQSIIKIADGSVIVLDIENEDNFQIRNDHHLNHSLRKDEELSSRHYHVLFPKEQESSRIPDDAIVLYKNLKKAFDNKNDENQYGVDYNMKSISIFNNQRYDIKIPKELDIENFGEIINKYIQILEQISSAIELIKE